MLVETAGGPNSPGPTGTLQTDLYRPLRLPIIFVADYRLGGISTSISSYESLKLRGYDVEGIAVFRDSYYRNWEYFQSFFQTQNVPVLALAQPPARTERDDVMAMHEYYDKSTTRSLTQSDAADTMAFVQTLQDRHDQRLDRLESMATRANDCIWYPFTQHQHVKPKSITTIDSAFGDYFQTLEAATASKSPSSDPIIANRLCPTLDGSASWWTQGLGHANPALATSAAYAAGRYGHVMFAEAIHEPALSLAETMLQTVANPRLTKVFYSDNGSTGMEVATKMALTASCKRYNWDKADGEIEVLGLQGSYHGDTMGTMDLSEPSVYNEKITWYKGRGFWFEPPSVKMKQGEWVLEQPANLRDRLGDDSRFASLQDVFDAGRDSSEQAKRYEKHVRETLECLTGVEKRRFGALVMEPVVLGAGGMLLVYVTTLSSTLRATALCIDRDNSDPLFQRTLARVVRASSALFSSASDSSPTDLHAWTGLPLIHDEVFTGLYRLGARTSSDLLHTAPDISVHAKLLTGGLVPLATTLASQSIFDAFLADGKADALLHGHSYTAHAVGCAVATTSVRMLTAMDAAGKWAPFQADWAATQPPRSAIGAVAAKTGVTSLAAAAGMAGSATPAVWSVWSARFVAALSHATARVDGVWALGSVLAVTLRDEQGVGGYSSGAAIGVRETLRQGQGDGWAVHCRVLGNVLYLMASQTSELADVRAWEGKLSRALGIV